jgi:hypothetical protein
METSVNNKRKAFASLEQSKTLAEILPLESADMYWKNGVSDKYIQCFTPFVTDDYRSNVDYDYDIPCWSLAALLGVLPQIQGGKPVISLDDNYITYPHVSDLHTKADNLVDACYEMILKLHELNLL